MNYYKKIDGKNVYLASVNVNDAEYYAELKNRKDELSRIVFDSYLNNEQYDKDKAYNELNDLAIKNSFAIIDKSKNRFIGLIGLSNTLQMNQRSDMWIRMFPDNDFETQVIKGAEAVDLLLKYCYDFMNLHNITLINPMFNKQVSSIMGYSKMIDFGVRKNSKLYSDGNLYDTVYYQCTPKQYARNKFHNYTSIGDNTGKEIRTLNINEDKMSKVLKGDKITLEKYDGRSEFIKVMASFLNNPEVSINVGEYKVNWNDYRSQKQLENVDYLIMRNDQLLGYLNLFRKDLINRTADLEILIGEASNHRKGYASEAIRLYLKEQYKNGPFNNILSCVFDFNEASKRMHESLNYNPIGVKKEAYFANGKLNDMYLYEMTKDNYEKIKVK